MHAGTIDRAPPQPNPLLVVREVTRKLAAVEAFDAIRHEPEVGVEGFWSAVTRGFQLARGQLEVPARHIAQRGGDPPYRRIAVGGDFGDCSGGEGGRREPLTKDVGRAIEGGFADLGEFARPFQQLRSNGRRAAHDADIAHRAASPSPMYGHGTR